MLSNDPDEGGWGQTAHGPEMVHGYYLAAVALIEVAAHPGTTVVGPSVIIPDDDSHPLPPTLP